MQLRGDPQRRHAEGRRWGKMGSGELAGVLTQVSCFVEWKASPVRTGLLSLTWAHGGQVAAAAIKDVWSAVSPA